MSIDDLYVQPVAARACPECHAIQGHWGWCIGQGYAHTGPHPESAEEPAPTERAPSTTACECGVKFTGGLHSSWCPAT